ncbi:MAG: alpha-2-macroglobulin family protein [Chthoniobacteraceae bacterium]|jgi:uncharacterized protein YfaS (alpha-2-macroglobulin family)
MQSHTPAVAWKLASVPLEKLPAVDNRLDEYNDFDLDPLTGEQIYDPKTDQTKQKQTELLVRAFNLPVVTTGSCAASSDVTEDQLRDVTAALPAGTTLQGPYLIEASSTLPDKRIAGGRALVVFSNYILTEKRSAAKVFLHVAGMADALPVAGVIVRAVTDQNIELARAVTDTNGIATFSQAELFPAKKPGAYLFIADTKGGPSLAFADDSTYASGDSSTQTHPTNHCLVLTDRNLYRPGEDLKMKGLLRDITPAGLAIPATGQVDWQIHQGDGDKVVAEGKTTLSDYGTFEDTWHIPADAALGQCTIACSLGGVDYSGTTTIDVEEYRVPLFFVNVDATTETGTAAHMRVLSTFFHGGANSGARLHWKAEWNASAETGSNTLRYNHYAQIGPALDPDNNLSQTIEGDARLDGNGEASIACGCPFASNPAVGPSHVSWTADVTSVDGQTITGGTYENFASAPVILGVYAEEKVTDPRGIAVTLEEADADGNSVDDAATKVTVDLYHVTTRTVKERVAPLVYRYNNVDEFAKVDSRDATAPGSLFFSATDTGRYVIAVRAKEIATPMVACETTVTGEEEAEMPVENDTSFSLTTRGDPWAPGDKAVFTVQAPYAGVAWVCVETDDILDTMIVPLGGNAARIEVPIKAEYAPNATLAVYLTRPGGAEDLPSERFAFCPFNVSRPDRELSIAPHLDRTEARPGQTIHGEVAVTSEGKPVAAADLAVFAVDDAVLQLGQWTLPDPLSEFYPNNPFGIMSYQSLARYIDKIDQNGPFQKGFIIGDGGEENGANNNSTRKEFKTLAFWAGSLKTDGDGKATFAFEAPDNLTTYRVVAIGDTKANQFGGDATKTVKISKPLMVDPSLPRFVRDGDEVELRAVVRENFADSAAIMARCTTGSGCTLEAEPTVSGTALRDVPWVLRFKAKVTDPDLKAITVKFEAAATSNPMMADAVEISVPVSAPTITRHETVSGGFNGPGFAPAGFMPKDWTQSRGQYATTLSTTSWLPAMAGIPTILDYPHGCFEQISSKLLCYALLGGLMDYLPGTEARLPAYRAIFQQAIGQISDSVLTDGRLPLWPGGTEPHDYATCQVCWALNEAAADGFDIPDGLTVKLEGGVKIIATSQGDIDTRAFALFVLASMNDGGDYSATAEDIYLHRDGMGMDGRALLAMAVHKLNIMPTEKLQLMNEIDKVIVPTAFKPDSFGSPDRTEGICAMAFETIAPPNFTAAKKDEIHKRLLHILDSASALGADNTSQFVVRFGDGYSITLRVFSTQENLWLLLAFKAMLDANPPGSLGTPVPAPAAVSKNGASAAWTARALGDELGVTGLNKMPLTFLMQSDFTMKQLDTARVDRGIRVERVVKDLTNAARTGAADAPYHIGDQLLVTYRIFSEKQQYYVALEDSLPGAFETVNPNIAQIGQFFELPPMDPNDSLLELSHSEMRDRSTLLYFDYVMPGSAVYPVLVRVTAAGTFRWPATQVTPMYDSRFSGLTASSVCYVSGE